MIMMLPEISRSMLKNSLVLGLFAIATVGSVTWLQQGTAERIQAAERAAQVRALGEILPAETYDNDLLADTVEVHDPLLGTRTPAACLHRTQSRQAHRGDLAGHRARRLQRCDPVAGRHRCRRTTGWRTRAQSS